MGAVPHAGFVFRKAFLIGVSVLGTAIALALVVDGQFLAAICVYALSMCFVALIVLRGVRLATEPRRATALAPGHVSGFEGSKSTK